MSYYDNQLGASGNGGTLGGSTASIDQSPGLFGSYQVQPIPIDSGSFSNPLGAGVQQQLGGELNNYLSNTTKPVVAQSAGYGSQAGYNAGMNGEKALAGAYNQLASGNGPSAATVAAGQQGAAGLAASESMLGSARGAGNPGAAQIAARTNQATTANQVAQNAVAGRTNEELGALGAEGSLYGAIAGQGLNEQGIQSGVNTFNAGQANTVAMNNQTNVLGANTNLMGTLGGQNLAQQQGQEAAQELNAQTQLGLQGIQSGAYSNAQNNYMKAMGAIMQGTSGAVGAVVGSDKNIKTKISKTRARDINKFIKQLGEAA